jgi:hypothetical protein
VWPHALVGLVTFATMFGVLTELPGALSHAPYSLSAGILGVSVLAGNEGVPAARPAHCSLLRTCQRQVVKVWLPFLHAGSRDRQLSSLTPHCLLSVCALLLLLWLVIYSCVQVAYLADGIPGLIGSPIGGVLSDKSAAAHPSEPEARLVHNTLIALVTMPTGLLLYAWALHARTHLVAIFAGMALVAFGCAAYLPGLFGYLTTLKQSAAAAASAAVQSMMFIMAGVVILVSAVATRSMGYGPWFTLLAGVQLLVTVYAYVVILIKQRAAHRRDQELPAVRAGSVVAQQQQQGQQQQPKEQQPVV